MEDFSAGAQGRGVGDDTAKSGRQAGLLGFREVGWREHPRGDTPSPCSQHRSGHLLHSHYGLHFVWKGQACQSVAAFFFEPDEVSPLFRGLPFETPSSRATAGGQFHRGERPGQEM